MAHRAYSTVGMHRLSAYMQEGGIMIFNKPLPCCLRNSFTYCYKMDVVRLKGDNNLHSLCQIHFKHLGFLF